MSNQILSGDSARRAEKNSDRSWTLYDGEEWRGCAPSVEHALDYVTNGDLADRHDGNCLCNACTAGIGDTPEPRWTDEYLPEDYYVTPEQEEREAFNDKLEMYRNEY